MRTASAEKTLNFPLPSDGISKSFFAMEAPQTYLVAQTWQITDIQEAIAEAENGEFASDQEVTDIFAKHGC
jgi:RHH-type transcriptional regulator, rel operon repressor / antitoxin RelB